MSDRTSKSLKLKVIKSFKTEEPDYELYNPVAPNYSDDEREEVENTQVRDKKRFRCPFRRERRMDCLAIHKMITKRRS